jgi:hypothetical protein
MFSITLALTCRIKMISPCCWWQRQQLLRLSIIVIVIVVCCCGSSSAFLSLQNALSKSFPNSWGPSVAQRPKFFGRLLGPNINTSKQDHDTRHGTASLLFMTGSMTPPPPTTTTATATTLTKRFLNNGGDDNDYDKKTKDNDQTKGWIVMYEKLKAYKEMYGNCLVPARFVSDDGTKLGRWVINQRQMHVKDAALRERRRRELDAIGFVWVVNERTRQLTPTAGVHASKEERFNARWNAMFDKLKEYKAEHGDCLVPRRYNCTDGTPLGHWVKTQRSKAVTDSDMNPLRRRALDSVGFVWQVRVQGRSQKFDEQWNEKFLLLQEYHAEHGDCSVPLDYVTAENKIRLGFWVQRQRATHAAGKLPQDRLIRLESLDFSFRVLPDESIVAQWNRMFDQLIAYRQRHGDCLVPSDEPVLGWWVSFLRNKCDTLTRDQRSALDALGFIWDVSDFQWQAQFAAIERFHNQHGHFSITKRHQADHPGLLSWLRTQRERRERGEMDGDQMERLDAIGFIWNVLDTKWQAQFDALERFQKQYGHCSVTNRHEAEFLGLYWWIRTQRERRERGEMDGDQMEQLDSIGFFWCKTTS